MHEKRASKRNFALAISLVLVAAMFSFYLSPSPTPTGMQSYYPHPSISTPFGNLLEKKKPVSSQCFCQTGDDAYHCEGRGGVTAVMGVSVSGDCTWYSPSGLCAGSCSVTVHCKEYSKRGFDERTWSNPPVEGTCKSAHGRP